MHIPGAEEANQKVADMIETHMESISDIFVTLRSRRVLFASFIMLLVWRYRRFLLFCRNIISRIPASGKMRRAKDLLLVQSLLLRI
jgi:hypothetical protein